MAEPLTEGNSADATTGDSTQVIPKGAAPGGDGQLPH